MQDICLEMDITDSVRDIQSLFGTLVRFYPVVLLYLPEHHASAIRTFRIEHSRDFYHLSSLYIHSIIQMDKQMEHEGNKRTEKTFHSLYTDHDELHNMHHLDETDAFPVLLFRHYRSSPTLYDNLHTIQFQVANQHPLGGLRNAHRRIARL